MENAHTRSPASTSQLQADWYSRFAMARAIASYKEVVAASKVETR